ncbi:cytochrome b/b6 domain-containing protein [Actinocorallia populi]|uniref:cytochrome b/b6 domain-containing protein n=1 Tax=Actinocorallia populi TaxID=2079200 RepID=UPI000D090577|nr:cytochrome b/b6 domain-containing protein [Actinocorallia populi]
MRRLPRFGAPERTVHHATALLMIVCLLTAVCLYLPAVSTLVGRRHLLRTIHLWAGFALPVPVLLGWFSRGFRQDLRRLDRFTPVDRQWLRRRDRRAVRDGTGVLPVGKFNAGQKINAAFVAGSILVMTATGAMLAFPGPWPVPLRTGATFVHDWLFLAVAVMTCGHLWYALRDREALIGMATGSVPQWWARAHHSGWAAEEARRAGGAEPLPNERPSGRVRP